MYLIRRAKVEDVGTLLKLAKMVHFINLPADRDIIAGKILRSRESFMAAAEAAPRAAERSRRNGSTDQGLARITESANLFMFVLEDVESGSVLGTSQVISRMGGPGHPNISFDLEKVEKFSSTLQTGATHMVARLHLDERAPTEIGGLILQPSYRGHKKKLGRFLSLVRFHFMGLHRPFFADQVLAEMMAPITPDGRNTLWDYLGRRFINLSYEEADRFCQFSKEFMISLLPHGEIYLSLLPPEARSVVGQVGPETVPARKMLERLGFEYLNRIDPFDGGPHLEAQTDKIRTVRDTSRARLGDPIRASETGEMGIISVLDADGEFRAIETSMKQGRTGRISIDRASMKLLNVAPGDDVGCTLLTKPGETKTARAAANGRGRKRTTKRQRTRG